MYYVCMCVHTYGSWRTTKGISSQSTMSVLGMELGSSVLGTFTQEAMSLPPNMKLFFDEGLYFKDFISFLSCVFV